MISDAARGGYSVIVPNASEKPRTLIFGGTFDPPHRAHVDLPQAAARELRCDRILYIPAAINPLKASPDVPPPTAALHRLAMLRLALRDVPNAEISTIEIDRAGKSYTIDTLRALMDQASRHQGIKSKIRRGGASSVDRMHLLIGADQALDFHRWKDWREVQALATPAVMLRPPWTRESFDAALMERFGAIEATQWMDRTLRTLPMVDVSATEVRDRLHAGKAIDDLVAPQVAAYIRLHRLYEGN